MEKEELLKPRYKVIADYPDSYFAVGEIVNVDENGDSVYYEDFGRVRINVGSYPHIFKKLEWWEEREEKDMPEYIKYNRLDNGELKVVKVDEIIIDGINDKYRYGKSWNSFNSQDLPATKEEYEQQLKKEIA